MSGDPEAFKALEASGWGARAETYDDLTGQVTARVAERLLDCALVGPGMRVLDVATGPGHIAGRALARGARCTGIDIAPEMLAVARRRYPGLELIEADADQRLPFEDRCFDAVVGGFVLNHLPRPERALAEFARVLAPAGVAAFAVWDRPERMRVTGVISEAIEEVGVERPPDLAGGPDPYRFADESEFARALRAAGYDAVAVQTIALTQHVRGADQLWDGLLRSSVRASAEIGRQRPEIQRRIRSAFERRVEPYRTDDGLELPAVVKIGSGRKA
ncbi:MAG: methyltransferase domain-containing protein [Actinobacteria bacterium]|nr:methyltransferase domain-containing protein [Actinomycetota bacterium]